MPRLAKRKASGPADAGTRSNKKRTQGSEAATTTRTSGFAALSEELILEILDCFLDESWRTINVRSLYNLCLTSRQIYRLAKPYLYAIMDNQRAEPGKLLRTILQEPHMAQRLQVLQWVDDHSEMSTWNKKSKMYKLSHIERRELCKKVEELGLLDPRLYSRGFLEQRPKDNLAALLLLTSNVRYLDVTDTNVCCYPTGYPTPPIWVRLLGEVGFTESSSISQHFQHLSTIRLRMGAVRLAHIVPILGIRSLRTLMLEDIFQVGAASSWAWGSGISERSSPVENLYLENSYIDSVAVAQILRSIRGLRIFCLEFDDWVRSGAYRVYDDDSTKLHYPTLAAAILEHKDTLEQLSIADSADADLKELSELDEGNLGSLRDLHKVHFVDVELEAFGKFERDVLGERIPTGPADLSENLPSGVAQLELNIEEEDHDDYEVYWRQSLNDLSRFCRPNLPGLKEVKVARKRLGMIHIDEGLTKMKEEFAKQDVKLVIVEHEEYFSCDIH